MIFQTEQWVATSLERAFRFFADPQNLPRISPPTNAAQLEKCDLAPPPAVPDNASLAGAGSRLVISARMVPFLPLRGEWIAQITEFEYLRYFADIQLDGPFKKWHHRHEFQAALRDGRQGVIIRDVVDYEVGFSIFGILADALFVRRQLASMFTYRQRQAELLLTEK